MGEDVPKLTEDAAKLSIEDTNPIPETSSPTLEASGPTLENANPPQEESAAGVTEVPVKYLDGEPHKVAMVEREKWDRYSNLDKFIALEIVRKRTLNSLTDIDKGLNLAARSQILSFDQKKRRILHIDGRWDPETGVTEAPGSEFKEELTRLEHIHQARLDLISNNNIDFKGEKRWETEDVMLMPSTALDCAPGSWEYKSILSGEIPPPRFGAHRVEWKPVVIRKGA